MRCYGALPPGSATFLGSKEPSFAGQRGAAAPQASLQPPSPAGVVASGVIAAAKPLLLLYHQHRGPAEQQRSFLSDPKGGSTSVILLQNERILSCVWPQFAGKKGRFS